jgi:hypothetical protein
MAGLDMTGARRGGCCTWTSASSSRRSRYCAIPSCGRRGVVKPALGVVEELADEYVVLRSRPTSPSILPILPAADEGHSLHGHEPPPRTLVTRSGCTLLPRREQIRLALCLPSSAWGSHPGPPPGHGTVQSVAAGSAPGSGGRARKLSPGRAHIAALPSPGMLGRLCLTAYWQRRHGDGWDLVPCQLLGRLPRPGS